MTVRLDTAASALLAGGLGVAVRGLGLDRLAGLVFLAGLGCWLGVASRDELGLGDNSEARVVGLGCVLAGDAD